MNSFSAPQFGKLPINLTPAQQYAIRDAKERGWFTDYNTRIATLRILVNHGLARKGFVREDVEEVARLTQEGILDATAALGTGDWRKARTILNAISDIHGNMARTRWYLTDAGKAFQL